MINFYFFNFSSYMLVMLLAFVISFILFYSMAKNKYNKLDIIYIFLFNILGFAIGAKIFSLFDKKQMLTILNFLNSGYAFIGGLIGSFISIYLYCKKYKLAYTIIQSYFTIIYPLIYSIGKIACYINGCCNGIIYNFPLQLIEAIFMLLLFIFLFKYFRNKNKYTIITFLIIFGIARFIIDFFRVSRNIFFINLTLSQLVCLTAVVIGIIYSKTEKHYNS